jgi:hypothetical protein
MSTKPSEKPGATDPAVPETEQSVADATDNAEKLCCCGAAVSKQAELVQRPPSEKIGRKLTVIITRAKSN